MYLLETVEIRSARTRRRQLGDFFVKEMIYVLRMGMKEMKENLQI